MKGKTSYKAIGVVAILLVAAVILGPKLLGGNTGMTYQVQSPIVVPQPTQQGNAPACASTGVNTVYGATQNPLIVGTGYSLARMAVVASDGTFLGAANGAGSSSLSWTSLASTIPCRTGKNTGFVYVIPQSTAQVNSAKKAYDVSASPTDNVLISASNGTDLSMTLYGSTGATNLSVAASVSGIESVAYAMTTGTTRNFFLDLTAGNTTAQFGSDDGQVLIVATYNNTAVFNQNSIALSSGNKPITPVACPLSAVQYDNGKICWKMPPIKGTDGIVRIAGVMTATLGNPGSGDGPVLYFEDGQYYEASGTVSGPDFYDTTGTNVGIERQLFTFVIS